MAARAPMKAMKAMKATKATTMKTMKAMKAMKATTTITKAMKAKKAMKAMKAKIIYDNSPFICDNSIADMPIKQQSMMIARAAMATEVFMREHKYPGREHLTLIASLLAQGISLSLTPRDRIPEEILVTEDDHMHARQRDGTWRATKPPRRAFVLSQDVASR